MDRVNYVEKAKRLMMGTARTTALVIVPLAAAVSHMQAAAIVLPTSEQSCNVTSDVENFSCGLDVSALSGSVITGVQFASSGSVFIFNSGGGTDSITMSAGGLLAGGSLSGTLPVDFNFSGSSGGFNPSGSWTVLMELGSTAGSDNFGSIGFSGGFSNTSGGAFSGSGTLSISGSVASEADLFETVVLTLPVNGGSDVEVTFPFNFDAVNASAVPEPASVATLGSGLGIMAWLFRRRRKKS
jgi:hypothetical protein